MDVSTPNPYTYYGYHCARTWPLTFFLPSLPLLFPTRKSFRIIDKDTHQVYFGTFAVVRKYSHLIPRRS